MTSHILKVTECKITNFACPGFWSFCTENVTTFFTRRHRDSVAYIFTFHASENKHGVLIVVKNELVFVSIVNISTICPHITNLVWKHFRDYPKRQCDVAGENSLSSLLCWEQLAAL